MHASWPRAQARKAFSRTGRSCDEKVLPFVHEIQGGEAFHLIALQPPVRGIVYIFKIGLVTECRIPGKPCYGSLGTMVPFPCKKHGKESVRRHGLRRGAGKAFPEGLRHTVQLHAVHQIKRYGILILLSCNRSCLVVCFHKSELYNSCLSFL